MEQEVNSVISIRHIVTSVTILNVTPRNRLQGETSPYLQQHVDNPIDWYPWGEEVLRKPEAFPTLLRAIAGLKQGFSTAVIVGEFNDLSTQKLADKSRSVLEPDEAIIIVSPSLEIPEMIDPSLLESPFALNGNATAYICLETSSRGPVQDPNDLMKWRR